MKCQKSLFIGESHNAFKRNETNEKLALPYIHSLTEKIITICSCKYCMEKSVIIDLPVMRFQLYE